MARAHFGYEESSQTEGRNGPPVPMTAAEESSVRRWLAHIAEFDPAMIAHVMDCCRTDSEKRGYYLRRSEEAPAKVAGSPLRHDAVKYACVSCAHRRGRAGVHWGCVARLDLPALYSEGHPLRELPADGGEDCSTFEARGPTWH